jgi:hypothetical protein
MTSQDSKENSFLQHDMLVVLVGAAVLAIGFLVQGGTAQVKTDWTSWTRDGLTVRYPKNSLWQPPTGEGWPARFVSGQCSDDPKESCGDNPPASIEVAEYDDEMGLGEIEAGKAHAEAYAARAKREIVPESVRVIGDKEWKCGRFGYVPVGVTREVLAIECSVVNNKKLYIVTLSAPEAYLAALEPQVIGTLALKSGEESK